MAIKLSTGEWELHTTPFAGLTVYANTIIMDATEPVTSKEYMDTLVHELIHASRKDQTERQVVKLAHDITEGLWRVGYRLRPHKRRRR
jgi:hypothetical protein